MPTHVERIFDDGRADHLGLVEPEGTLHEFTRDADGTVRDSILIDCHKDDIKARVLICDNPKVVTQPDDTVMTDRLRRTGVYSRKTTILRGNEREFHLTDARVGPFRLVIKHLVETPLFFPG